MRRRVRDRRRRRLPTPPDPFSAFLRKRVKATGLPSFRTAPLSHSAGQSCRYTDVSTRQPADGI